MGRNFRVIYPDAQPGLVVRFNYLWKKDQLEGKVEGDKDRPCAIIISSSKTGFVTLLPITHSPPDAGEEHLSIEIPLDICEQIGLDDGGNYIRLGETNRFLWPGRDLRPLRTDPTRIHYGVLPKSFFDGVIAKVISMVKHDRVSVTKRD